jgi:hypothetical protein
VLPSPPFEPAPATDGASDIVEYETATGKRSLLISHTLLTPPKAERPLEIEDYRWDKDQKRLLLYTASRKVWRTNSRGDYRAYSVPRDGGDKRMIALFSSSDHPSPILTDAATASSKTQSSCVSRPPRG